LTEHNEENNLRSEEENKEKGKQIKVDLVVLPNITS
jgi:hypothetical protein